MGREVAGGRKPGRDLGSRNGQKRVALGEGGCCAVALNDEGRRTEDATAAPRVCANPISLSFAPQS